ncbi:LPXTG cell wall anchor domain-containing protein [Agromyces humatus]
MILGIVLIAIAVILLVRRRKSRRTGSTEHPSTAC